MTDSIMGNIVLGFLVSQAITSGPLVRVVL
jgi:hypothetical protein